MNADPEITAELKLLPIIPVVLATLGAKGVPILFSVLTPVGFASLGISVGHLDLHLPFDAASHTRHRSTVKYLHCLTNE